MSTFKKTPVVMLPTNEKAPIINQLDVKHHLILTPNYKWHLTYNWQYQHLYFLSDEKIKEGNWCLDIIAKQVFQVDNKILKSIQSFEKERFEKIIATTNKSLKIGENQCDGCKAGKPLENGYLHRMNGGKYPDFMSCQKDKYLVSLPQPSQSFIEKFVEEYNKGNVITEVMVEYEEDVRSPMYGSGLAEYLKLKVNPKDNTITIRKVKDSWNREEVINILDTLLEYPDVLIDAVQNENTKYDGKALLDLLDNL